MKKLILAISILLLTGCAFEPGNITVRELNHKGHDYLYFKWEALYGQGWVHNPDCQGVHK